MKSVISSDKHVLNQRERDALHHGPDFTVYHTVYEMRHLLQVQGVFYDFEVTLLGDTWTITTKFCGAALIRPS